MKKLSNGQWRRIAKQKFERVTGLHDGDKVIGTELLQKELGTYTRVFLGGARKVSSFTELDCPQLPQAILVITPQGEVLMGKGPIVQDDNVTKREFAKFCREFAPNGQNPVSEGAVVTLDIGELFERRAYQDYFPEGVVMGKFGPRHCLDPIEQVTRM